MEDKTKIIGSNLAYYRKQAGLTQTALADMINFSDKSISKWERGDGVPDINVLLECCKIFNITIDMLTSEERIEKPNLAKSKARQNELFIALLSSGLVWLVATIVFVFLKIFLPSMEESYLCFIYAIPLFYIVLTVFSYIWGTKKHKLITLSLAVWTAVVPFICTFGNEMANLFYIAIPLQVLIILWYVRKTIIKK